MGQPPCKWDDGTYANRGDVSYGTAALAVWDPTYLHLAPNFYVTSAAAIDTNLSRNANITLLGPYGTGDAGVEIIRCRKTVYAPAPYVGLLLCADLTPVEAWNRLRRAILDAAAEAACRPLIDGLRATLIVPKPSAPLPRALLLQHSHRFLLRHLSRIDPSLNLAAGTRIAETVGEVAVELRETWL